MSAASVERADARSSGRRAILAYLPGSAAWGLISGVAMVKGGLAPPWAIAMSLIVYAASAQLAALPLIVAGAPLPIIIATGFVTNLRFVIYSAAIRPFFTGVPLARRALFGFLMTDFTFTRFMRAAQEGALPARHRDSWFAGMCTMTWPTWHASAIVGIIAASYVPSAWGLEFTGTLALVALAGPSLVTRPAVLGAIVAAVVAVLTHPLPYKLGLFCGALAGIVAATLSDGWRDARTEEAA